MFGLFLDRLRLWNRTLSLSRTREAPYSYRACTEFLFLHHQTDHWYQATEAWEKYFGYTEKSAVAEHVHEKEDYRILFENIQVLEKISYLYPLLFMETIEEEGLKMSRTWTQVINTIKTLLRRKRNIIHILKICHL